MTTQDVDTHDNFFPQVFPLPPYPPVLALLSLFPQVLSMLTVPLPRIFASRIRCVSVHHRHVLGELYVVCH